MVTLTFLQGLHVHVAYIHTVKVKLLLGHVLLWLTERQKNMWQLVVVSFAVSMYHQNQFFLSFEVTWYEISWKEATDLVTFHNILLLGSRYQLVIIHHSITSGDVQTSVDGILHSYNIGLPAAGTTVGPVLMGSRYHHSGTNFPDARVFQGKIACMRLWNTVRDLTSLRMDTPLCVTN